MPLIHHAYCLVRPFLWHWLVQDIWKVQQIQPMHHAWTVFRLWPFGWSVRHSYFPPPPQKNSEIILPFYYRSTCFSCRSSPAVAASNGKIYAIGGDQISEVNFYRARYEELPNIMYFWSEPSLLITLSVCLSIWALLWL